MQIKLLVDVKFAMGAGETFTAVGTFIVVTQPHELEAETVKLL